MFIDKENTLTLHSLQQVVAVLQMELSEFFRMDDTSSPNPVLEEIDGIAGFLATKPLDDVRFLHQMVRSTADHLDHVRHNP